MNTPSVLDHLVPAFGADVYGASFDKLPLNVWMKSNIKPMNFGGASEDYRYRVVMFGGERRVEFGLVNREVDGRIFLAKPIDPSGVQLYLPKAQHAAFARTATVDLNPDLSDGIGPTPDLAGDRLSAFLRNSVQIGGFIAFFYAAYRASTRRSSQGSEL